MPGKMVTVTDTDFATVVGAETPTLVDFWAEWCGPCRIMNAPLEELAGEHVDRLTVAKLNVDENPATTMQHQVMSLPTLIVFQNGVEKKRLIGARSKSQLVAELTEFTA